MRVHKRRRVHPMHPPCGNTGLGVYTQRAILSLRLSLLLSPSFPYLFSKTTAVTPAHSQPFRPPHPATKRLGNSAGRSCAPIEMYRFHYKLLMRQICRSASRAPASAGLPLSRAVIVSIANNNIWATPATAERKESRGKEGKCVSGRRRDCSPCL